jgi:hypothetical protein
VASKIRGWLGAQEAIYFNEYLADYRNEVLDKLTKESDTTKFHRLQGNLEVINTIIELRGEVDSYIKGVSSGKMRKIEPEKENEYAVGRQEVRNTGRA